LKFKYVIFLLLIVALVTGLYFSNKFIKTKQYDGLTDFIPSLISNATNTTPANDTLFISMGDSAFQKISEIRDRAVETGIIINPEDPWVKGVVVYQEDSIKVKMRLKGKMTDHVKGDKWSYRIKTKKGKLIMGMHRFSIQHPGTRNYLYEWMHLQMAREQGMMALDYSFVRVIFNGKDLGIYAVEENFDKELAFNNQRSLGPIFRFDPDAFWEYRLLGITGYRLKPEYTKFQSAFIDPMRSFSVNDSAQRQYLEEALILMNAFREQKVSASDVFELDLFARRYALLDLIGGFKSVDWSDLKFYYNPNTKKIEPIAYESFSGFRINTLIGFDRYLADEIYHNDFHTLLFSDSVFYAIYYSYLQAFSQPEFIDEFLVENDSAIAYNMQVLNNEFPYKRFDRNQYDYNAKMIRKLTHPKYPLHVFVSPGKSEGLMLKISNVSAIPVKVLGVNREDEFYPAENLIIEPKLSNGFAEFHEIEVSGLMNFDGAQLVYTLLGNEEKEYAEVFQYDHPQTDITLGYPFEAKQYFNDQIGRMFDINGDKIIFRPGVHRIEWPLIIPDSMELIGFSPLEIQFSKGGMIVSGYKIKLEGGGEDPILISSIDDTGGFVLLESGQKNSFKNVIFKAVGAPNTGRFSYPSHINVYRATLKIEGCLFESSETTMLNATDALIDLNETDFYRVESAIHAKFSELKLSNCVFAEITGNAISVDATNVVLNDVSVNDCKKKAFNIEKWSIMNANRIKTTNCKIGIAVKSGSLVNINNWQKAGNEFDIDLKSKVGYGISELQILNSGDVKSFVVEKDEESLLKF
jgi:hypothetical protein